MKQAIPKDLKLLHRQYDELSARTGDDSGPHTHAVLAKANDLIAALEDRLQAVFEAWENTISVWEVQIDEDSQLDAAIESYFEWLVDYERGLRRVLLAALSTEHG